MRTTSGTCEQARWTSGRRAWRAGHRGTQRSAPLVLLSGQRDGGARGGRSSIGGKRAAGGGARGTAPLMKHGRRRLGPNALAEAAPPPRSSTRLCRRQRRGVELRRARAAELAAQLSAAACGSIARSPRCCRHGCAPVHHRRAGQRCCARCCATTSATRCRCLPLQSCARPRSGSSARLCAVTPAAGWLATGRRLGRGCASLLAALAGARHARRCSSGMATTPTAPTAWKWSRASAGSRVRIDGASGPSYHRHRRRVGARSATTPEHVAYAAKRGRRWHCGPRWQARARPTTASVCCG